MELSRRSMLGLLAAFAAFPVGAKATTDITIGDGSPIRLRDWKTFNGKGEPPGLGGFTILKDALEGDIRHIVAYRIIEHGDVRVVSQMSWSQHWCAVTMDVMNAEIAPALDEG